MGQNGWLGCRDADQRGQNVLVAICPGPPFLCAYAEPDPRTPLATFWGEDSDPVLVSKPRGRSMSHQMRAKLQRCVERVHGAKDEDDAPWTNLFTVHGLAPNGTNLRNVPPRPTGDAIGDAAPSCNYPKPDDVS